MRSCILAVFATCTCTVHWAIFDAQAWLFVDFRLPLLIDNNQIDVYFLMHRCTVSCILVFLPAVNKIVHLPCPGLFFMRRRGASWILDCRHCSTVIRPYPTFVHLGLSISRHPICGARAFYKTSSNNFPTISDCGQFVGRGRVTSCMCGWLPISFANRALIGPLVSFDVLA